MKKSRLLMKAAYTCAAFCIILTGHAQASIIDQSQTNSNASFGLGAGGNTAQQGITAGVSGNLVGFDLWSNGIGLNSSIDISVFVNIGSPWQVDANSFETTVTFNASDIDTWVFVDTSSAGITLTTGQDFTIGITPPGAYDPGGYVNNPYSGGNFFFNGVESTSFDLAFRTHMSAVPVPAAAWLFGSGLLGLVGMARRKKAA